ncbi:four helix bundle protein [Patescibacteria group bacterium]|nr:four helix bundle protein [Patescibacteria group bacterium]
MGTMSIKGLKKSNKSYRKLILWEKLIGLLVLTYKLTDKLPRSEEFGLKSQTRRAIVSVVSNFVEGYLKRSVKEKLRYLEISGTSLLELEAQAEICRVLEYWSEKELERFEEKRSIAGYFLYRYRLKIEKA